VTQRHSNCMGNQRHGQSCCSQWCRKHKGNSEHQQVDRRRIVPPINYTYMLSVCT